jgi:hypothetical protein
MTIAHGAAKQTVNNQLTTEDDLNLASFGSFYLLVWFKFIPTPQGASIRYLGTKIGIFTYLLYCTEYILGATF